MPAGATQLLLGIDDGNLGDNSTAPLYVELILEEPPPPSPTVYKVGDKGPAGGIVVSITSNGIHGIEASPTDLPSMVGWSGSAYCNLNVIAPATAVGTGKANTDAIIAACETGTAAYNAKNYSLNGYTDWYLPSYDELKILFHNQSILPVFCSHNIWYWSASDHYGAHWNALALPCSTTSQWDVNKGVGFPVRAIRDF